MNIPSHPRHLRYPHRPVQGAGLATAPLLREHHQLQACFDTSVLLALRIHSARGIRELTVCGARFRGPAQAAVSLGAGSQR